MSILGVPRIRSSTVTLLHPPGDTPIARLLLGVGTVRVVSNFVSKLIGGGVGFPEETLRARPRNMLLAWVFMG